MQSETDLLLWRERMPRDRVGDEREGDTRRTGEPGEDRVVEGDADEESISDG